MQGQGDEQQPVPAAAAAALQDPAQDAKGSRKRKATSAGEADNAACALPSSAQQQHSPGAAVVARPKRRKTQLQAPAHPASEAAEPESLPSATQPSSNQHSAAAAAAVPVRASTALVPAVPRQVVVPTGSTVQLGVDSSNQMMMQQLRSALAAHEASKRQLRVALEALEASEGQLAAVARAAGLL